MIFKERIEWDDWLMGKKKKNNFWERKKNDDKNMEWKWKWIIKKKELIWKCKRIKEKIDYVVVKLLDC